MWCIIFTFRFTFFKDKLRELEERLPAVLYSALTGLNCKGDVLPQNSGLPRLASDITRGSSSLVQLHGSAAAVGRLVRSGAEMNLRGKQKCYIMSFFSFSSSLCYECDFRAR